MREWFLLALDTAAPPLPSAPAFQHMFLGLCTLADWIGLQRAVVHRCPALDTWHVTLEPPPANLSRVSVPVSSIDWFHVYAVLVISGKRIRQILVYGSNRRDVHAPCVSLTWRE